MKFSYNWIQDYFKEKLPEPKELAELLTMHSFQVEEVISFGGDFILDIDVLPNRAHDCLSHYGIARDISVVLDKKFSFNNTRDKQDNSAEPESDLIIEILDEVKCRRYVGTEIRNIKVEQSPNWLKERLETIGQRSINNIVDIANYIMLSYGQPLHIFDADKLADKKIVVREAKKGEKMITLDGDEKELDSSILVISDGDNSLAIAGIKGGVGVEIDINTKNIVVESANFEPVNIRNTSRKLNLHTDASKRFENEPSPELVQLGMSKVVDMIVDIAGTEKTKIMKAIDIYNKRPEKVSIDIKPEDVNKLLGASVNRSAMEDIFNRFNFDFNLNGDIYTVKIPSERLDLKIKADLIEEIGRVYGYEKIKAVVPKKEGEVKINKEFYYIIKIKNILISLGFSEVYNYSFVEKGEVEIKNPISSDKKFLRTNLIDSLKKNLELNKKNLHLLNMDELSIFEIGKVFNNGEEYLSLALVGEEKKDGIEKLSKEFEIEFKEETNLNKIFEKLPAPKSYSDLNLKLSNLEIKYCKISPYPFIQRDIAIWAPDGTDVLKVQKLIKENAGDLLVVGPRLFDTFKKDDKISYAFNMVFQSLERTLTDVEVGEIMAKIETKIVGNKGWQVR